MKKRGGRSGPVIEDPSPQSTFRESIGNLSIDFGRASFGSLHDELGLENEIVPNLAVIEELESIRGMIEMKSKDLHKREASLSRSVSKWNSDIVTAQGLVEELAVNLIDVGEKRLNESFEGYVLKLKKLISQLNDRIKKHDLIAKKAVKSTRGFSDTPPIPVSENACSPILASVLGWISENPNSVSRRVACSSVLICASSSVVSPEESKFVVNSVYSGLLSLVRAKIHLTFMQSIDSGLVSALVPSETSRFSQAKRILIKKQLGLPEAPTSSVEILLASDSIGEDRLIDVNAELDEHLQKIWIDAAKVKSPPRNTDHIIRLWSDPAAQAHVLQAIKQKASRRGIRYSLIQICLGSSDARTLSDSFKELKRIVNDYPKRFIPLLDGIVHCLVFVSQKCVEDDKGKALLEETRAFVSQLLANNTLGEHLATVLSNSHQLLWFLFRNTFFPANRGDLSTSTEMYMLLLEKADDPSSLSPWRDRAIEAIHQKLVPDNAMSTLKNLVKRF
jgi:hypothetical protein